VLSLGCEVITGLNRAGETIFPDKPTYVNAPGLRLARGEFADLDYATHSNGITGAGIQLLARGADPGDSSLTLIGFTDGKTCRIEDVGAYASLSSGGLGGAAYAYLDGPGPRGTLRFATQECEVLPVELPDASLPFSSARRGRRMVHSGSDIVLVDPDDGTVEMLVSDVERILYPSSDFAVVQSRGRLHLFEDWEFVTSVGEGVVTAGLTAFKGDLFYEDETGIFRFTPPEAPVALVGGACHLGFPRSLPGFIAFHAPCAEEHLVAYRGDETLTIDLGQGADPRQLEFWFTAWEPELKIWMAHLSDVEATGLGTLHIRDPDGEEWEIGERAALGWVSKDLVGQGGYALVNVEGETGDIVHWDTEGNTSVLAGQVLLKGDGVGVQINYDGVAADIAFFDGLGGLTVELLRAPLSNYYYVDDELVNVMVMTDFDGRTGTLSRMGESYGELAPVATDVLHPHHGFIDQLFPGLAWIRSTDARRGTGRLEYRNDDLGFTATVSDGVSDFLQSTRGFIYAVPHGSGAGIWFAEAK
jgi:hypothetical protein